MEEEITKISNLLGFFKELPKPAVIEENIFSIGSKSYYENPTTDILAYFLDITAQHNLSDLLLKSLIDCLPDDYKNTSMVLLQKPIREYSTKSQKRIDLVLEGSDWVIILENKIYHEQNNPFEEYEICANEFWKNKRKIYIILSPKGTSERNGWNGIGYNDLISSIKNNLNTYNAENPINKWSILLREFVLHLENIMKENKLDDKTLEFVFDNIDDIINMQITKQLAIETYQRKIQKALETKLSQEIKIHLESWNNYPAMRFFLTNKEISNIVLYLYENNGYGHSLYVKLQNPGKAEIADKHILKTSSRVWFESSERWRCYERELSFKTFDELIDVLAESLEQLRKYEDEESLLS